MRAALVRGANGNWALLRSFSFLNGLTPAGQWAGNNIHWAGLIASSRPSVARNGQRLPAHLQQCWVLTLLAPNLSKYSLTWLVLMQGCMWSSSHMRERLKSRRREAGGISEMQMLMSSERSDCCLLLDRRTRRQQTCNICINTFDTLQYDNKINIYSDLGFEKISVHPKMNMNGCNDAHLWLEKMASIVIINQSEYVDLILYHHHIIGSSTPGLSSLYYHHCHVSGTMAMTPWECETMMADEQWPLCHYIGISSSSSNHHNMMTIIIWWSW